MARDPIQLPPDEPLFDPDFLNLEYFFNLIFRIFDWIGDLLAFLAGFGPGHLSSLVRTLLWLITLALLAGIIYAAYKYRKVREEERERFYEAHISALETTTVEERNRRWQDVMKFLDSINESDWRLAIIEADTM